MASLLSKRLEEELRSDLERGTIVWNELGTVNRAVYARRLGVTKRALPQSVLLPYDDLGPKKETTESVLRSLLEQDFHNESLVFSKPGFIDKRHYASHAGCSNTQYYKELFAEFEAKVGAARTSDALIELLSRDFEAGTLRFSRGGKIDRTSYATQLAVTKSSLTSHIALFQGFEERLSGTGRYRDNDLEKMAKWLETNFQSGLLRFSASGKLVRKQFKDAFGITHADFETRFPAVGSLIHKYDALQQRRLLEAGPRLGADEPKIAKRHSAKPESSPGSEGRRASGAAVPPFGQSVVSEKSASALFSPEIIAAIDAAVCDDLARCELRLTSDGSIDRSFYVGQAVASASAALGQVFDRYSTEVAHYNEHLDPVRNDIAMPMADDHEATSVVYPEAIKQATVHDTTSRDEMDAIVEPEAMNVSTADLVGPLLVYYPRLARHQNYDPGTPSADAVYTLNELVLGFGLPRCEDGTLNRAKLARILRISNWELVRYDTILLDYDIATRPSSDDNAFDDRHSRNLSNHPGLAVHRAYPPTSAFGRAVTILDRLSSERHGLARMADGSLNRDILARELQINSKALSTYDFIIEDYDRFDRTRALADAIKESVDPDKSDVEPPLALSGFASRPRSPFTEVTRTGSEKQANSLEVIGNLSPAEPAMPNRPGVLPNANASRREISEPVDCELIARYPEIKKHQHYHPDSARGRLVAILNQDLLSGTIPRSRGGKIDRGALCAKLGFTTTAMQPYLNILHDYESATGGLQNVHARRMHEMEAFLAAALEEGTLEVRDDKVERRQFFRHFGLTENKTVLVRNPGILALLEKYDELVKSTGYLPKRVRQEVEVLMAALDDDPPISKTGLCIDRTGISRITNISTGRIAHSPFAEALKEADIRLAQRVESDELCSVFAGRLFSFRPLLDAGWSHQFLKRVAEGFHKIYGAKSQDKSKDAYNALREILRFMAGSGDPSCRAVQSRLNAGNVRSVAARDWTLATQAYSTWINDREDLKGGTSKTKLGTASTVLRHLGNAGVLPELEMALRAKGEASSHRRTLAQAPSTEGVDDYLAFATAMLHEAAKLRQIDIDANDETGFLQTLRTELSGAERKADDTPAEIIKRVLKRRLKYIEDALAEVYVRWRRHWEQGQALLQAGESLGNDWKNILRAGSRNEHIRRTEMREFFPLDDPDRAVANLIRLVSDKFNGFYPRSNDENVEFGQFFAKRALEFGGAVGLQALITPHPHAIYAVILLYLCGSGANMAVGRTLFVDAVEQSQITGATHVTGQKARAGGKPIHAHLDSRSHAVVGMNWLLAASSSVREELKLDDRNLLFVVTERSGVKPVEEYTLRSFLKRIVSDIPEIAELGVTPGMLRPTVLLIAALEGDVNAHRAAALGQHTLNVGRGYIDHPPTRHMHDEGIRAFVDSFQIASFYADQNVTEWLGYASADIDTKIGEVMETGLGTLCRDLHGRPGNDGGKCKTFDCWKSCPQLVVIARKDDLALLIIWRASLIQAEAEWILERTERWYAVWFPWLEFIHTVERRILSTAMGKIWREATVLAAEIMAHPNFKPRRPF